MKTDGLSNFEKILLATQTVNFLTARLQGLIDDIKHVDHQTAKEIKESHEKALNEVLDGLADICNDLGDHMNGHDCIDADDEKITAAAFEAFNAA